MNQLQSVSIPENSHPEPSRIHLEFTFIFIFSPFYVLQGSAPITQITCGMVPQVSLTLGAGPQEMNRESAIPMFRGFLGTFV